MTETQISEQVHMTPANAVNNRQELVPLPLRIATSQKARLAEARDRTGISVQEHVRRGIDLYLGVIEREAIDLGLMPHRGVPPLAASALPITAAKPIPKIRKR
jgi:hypothetical protein